MTAITFSAPPTVGRFMRSSSFVRVIGGPVGSGKTSGCIFEILRRAIEQAPGPDGIRHTRWAIVRQTLQQLKMTVLLDILTWLRSIATYKVSEQLIVLRFADVRCEIFLIPLEDVEDQKRLLSSQLTGAWMSEGIEIDVDLVPAICGRVGRYPALADGGPTWYGVIVDTNMPTIGSPWWEMFENIPPDWQIFLQPGGLEPAAENLQNLPGGRGYYERLARSPNQAWVDRYVHAQYGEDPSGTAVWKSFKRSFHVVESLDPVPGQILLVGQDFGRNPCSLICQPNHKGALMVLEEVIAEDVGLENHILRSLRPRLFQDRYMGKTFCAVGDPSGMAKSNLYEQTSFDDLQRLGIPAFPAPSNDIEPRIAAVEQLLLQQIDGGPALVIDSSRCPMLVRAMQGAYRFSKSKVTQITKPVPDKTHPWSDLADCLQYVAMTVLAGLQVRYSRKIVAKGKKEKPRVSAAGWT